MSKIESIDYGPLTGLIGVWKGDKGTDIAPEPDGTETNPYYETITFTEAGDVSNAETQELVAVHYRQVVQRKSNDKVFHDQTGYWIWDARQKVVMHSFSIPRAVTVLAGGTCELKEGGEVLLEVAAQDDDASWQIAQSPFMQENAKTTSFKQQLCVGSAKLSYSQTMMLNIYGREFEHTDENALVKVR